MMGFGDPDARPRRPISRFTVLRWTAAAAAVIVAHGAGAWVALNWRPAEAAPSAPPPAVMIDLAPIAVAPPAPPQQVAPGPQQTESQPDPTQTVQDVKPDPAPPPVEQPTETPPSLQPPSEIKVPDLPKKDDAAAVLAPPPPPRRPKRKIHKKPPAKTREAERRRPIRPDKKRVRRTSAPPTSQARLAQAAAAPSAGASFAPSMSPATWKGELMARLNRYKRYPPDATSFGTASVAFTINRSGQVLASRLIGSSGDRALDEEAVSLPRRASPVPPPPPGIGGGSITLTVPIRFNR